MRNDDGYEWRMSVARKKASRKRHVQQELFRHGGKRRGAGRKPKGKSAGTTQEARPRNINTMLGQDKYRRRRGRVFADRYHVRVIKSPRQARNTLSYVLNNWRKHREDQAGLPATWLVDPFSSGISFPDWKEMEGRDL